MLRLGVDWVELDVCGTADGGLVLRHEHRMANGRAVAELSLAELRERIPTTLTLDEAVEVVRGRRPLLLDIKSNATVRPLGRWLARRDDPDGFAVCTEHIPALLSMRVTAPRVGRWPSCPDLGQDHPGWQRWVSEVARRHRTPRRLAWLVAEVARGVAELHGSTHAAGVARLGGVPWRGRLPTEIEALAARVDAAAFCFHHWLVTPELCAATHRLGLAAVAWTVNDGGVATRMRACGVDLITTDDVLGMRQALGDAPRG